MTIGDERRPSIQMRGRRRRIADATVGLALSWLLAPRRVAWFAHAPTVPGLGAFRRRPRWPGAWPQFTDTPPKELTGRAAADIEQDVADRAHQEAPLRNLWVAYKEWEDYLNLAWWRFSPWILPSYIRGNSRAAEIGSRAPARRQQELDPDSLADLVRAEAARVGFSQVGFAAYDPRWTYADRVGDHDTGTVIICLLEEDYQAEQAAPSVRHERRSMAQYAEQTSMLVELATTLQDRGYRAQAHDAVGAMLYIPYAVEAGLGQLGLNGQLLTPLAGARVTIMAITTEAVITRGRPRDFGIPAVCDACQACVRRCPVGAIPARRARHRGVLKAKINTGRCLATVVQADGCAVCSKVCPVQRYGLGEVFEHFAATGEILGRGSDSLEGFDWPLDGRHYPPGDKPRIDNRVFMHPNGMDFDPDLLFQRVREPSERTD